MSFRTIVDPDINPSAPWEGDPLERQSEGEALGRLLSTMTGTGVVAVMGPWGSGKSVFFRRLAAHMRTKFVPTVIVDAWRSDYLEDPLLAVTAGLSDALLERSGPESKDIVSKLANVSATLVGPITAVLSGGTLAPAGAAAGELGKKLLDWERRRRQAAQTFRQQLERARDLLTERTPDKPIRPIVLIIDELDRCRPDFAVRLLERMKHFFDVPGVVFVIGTDGTNLPNAVSSLYGPKVDGDTYLRKFFDFEFRLSRPSTSAFCSILARSFGIDAMPGGIPGHEVVDPEHWRYEEHSYSGMVKAKDRKLDLFEALYFVGQLSKWWGLNLRDQAQAFTAAYAYLMSTPASTQHFPAAVAYASCLRFFDAGAYARLVAGKSPQSVHQALEGALPTRKQMGNISKTDFGLDFILFCAAAAEDDPHGYASRLIRTARDQDKDSRRLHAGERLAARIKDIRQPSLAIYLAETLRMGEAFIPEDEQADD